MNEVKLYFDGNSDWFKGRSVEEVKAFHKASFGHDDIDFEEVTEDQLDRLMYFDDIENQETSEKRTFREQLALEIERGETVPEFFASSEY
jgi:hypothetical protein